MYSRPPLSPNGIELPSGGVRCVFGSCVMLELWWEKISDQRIRMVFCDELSVAADKRVAQLTEPRCSFSEFSAFQSGRGGFSSGYFHLKYLINDSIVVVSHPSDGPDGWNVDFAICRDHMIFHMNSNHLAKHDVYRAHVALAREALG